MGRGRTARKVRKRAYLNTDQYALRAHTLRLHRGEKPVAAMKLVHG